MSDTPTVTDDGLERFTEWFRKNYPGPDTIIHDPNWHAPKVYRAAIALRSEDPRIGELEGSLAKSREEVRELRAENLQILDEQIAPIQAERDTLAAQVKELRAVLELLLGTAIAFEKQASAGVGGRRGGPVFEKVRKALASTEHPTDDAVRQIERGALERAAKHFDKSAESATKTAESVPFQNQDDQVHWFRVAKSSRLAATAIRALAEGGE